MTVPFLVGAASPQSDLCNPWKIWPFPAWGSPLSSDLG